MRDFVFYSGYSVDLAILLQSMRILEPHNIAQVNFDQRVQKVQELIPLSCMSFEILTMALHRAEADGLARLEVSLGRSLKSFITNGKGEVSEEVYYQADVPLPLVSILEPVH